MDNKLYLLIDFTGEEAILYECFTTSEQTNLLLASAGGCINSDDRDNTIAAIEVLNSIEDGSLKHTEISANKVLIKGTLIRFTFSY